VEGSGQGKEKETNKGERKEKEGKKMSRPSSKRRDKLCKQGAAANWEKGGGAKGGGVPEALEGKHIWCFQRSVRRAICRE